jgi:prepilin-type processing-associated H-X9-DG protein
MYCPKCGTENVEGAEFCVSCSWVLSSTSVTADSVEGKISALAVTALILGILSVFTCFITALPAIICGIISLVMIEKSGGSLRGKGMAIAGIAVPAVILPLAMMMAILLPALARVRMQAKSVLCQSNLKQWGTICAIYVGNYDGYFMEDENWWGPLRPYFMEDEMMLCPMATKTEDEGGKFPFAAWRNEEIEGSYGMNYWVLNPQDERIIRGGMRENLWRTANVKGAKMVPLFLDCSSAGIWPLGSDKPPEYSGQRKGEGGNGDEIRDCCIDRHKGKINGAFLDFSVRRIGLKELWGLQWHRNWYADDEPEPEWPEWMDRLRD